ncbi:hypothetical protein [Novipirellula artificiosorum]|nr:hypothetical protein [Novipirellula artificiosorum]
MHDSLDFRSEFDEKKPSSDAAIYIYEFPASDNRPALKIYWYEGGRMPKLPEGVLSDSAGMKSELAKGGCMMVGDKNTMVSPGMRPNNPRLVDHWEEISCSPLEPTTPRAVGNPVQEIMAAIRGDIPKCGSNFDCAAPLTEMVLLGTIAIRSGKRVIYDPASMTFSVSSLNAYVKEPVRKGWEYGEELA